MDLYSKVKEKVTVRGFLENVVAGAGMAQGVTFQAFETFPDRMENIPYIENVDHDFFVTHLNPVGDKFVHLGALGGGSLAVMKGLDYTLEEMPEEYIMAAGLGANILTGAAVEATDSYVDMFDMAANTAGWYISSEIYFEEGPTSKLIDLYTSETGESEHYQI